MTMHSFKIRRNLSTFEVLCTKIVKGVIYWGYLQMLTDLTLEKAEVVDATPQDLSTVL